MTECGWPPREPTVASQLQRGPPSSACPVRSPVYGWSELTSECVAGGRKSVQIGRPAGCIGFRSGLDIEQFVHLCFASTGTAVTSALGHRVEGVNASADTRAAS